MTPTRFYNPANARQKHGDHIDRLATFLNAADPLADELVALFARLPAGRGQKMLHLALDRGIGKMPQAPEALRNLFAQLEDVPLWVDWKQLELGGATHRRCGIGCAIVLGCCALPMAYRAPAGNKPLVFTRQLLARAVRRLSETNRFFLESCRPGGLKPYGPAWKITVRVRLMHAQIRRLLRQSGRWYESDWGAPVNQVDLAGTNLLFSAVLLHYLRRLGFHFSAAESESVMQLWRYSGYLTGIDPQLLCASEYEGLRRWQMILDLDGPPDEDSRELTRVLLEVAMPMLATSTGTAVSGDDSRKEQWRKRLSSVYYGLSRALLGADIAAELNYPSSAWRHLLYPLRGTIAALELGRRLVPGGNALAVRYGDRWIQSLMNAQPFARHPSFQAPRRLPPSPTQPPILNTEPIS